MAISALGDPIRWRLHIPIPPEEVFRALDSNDGRAAFWAVSAVEQDSKIEFKFINGVTCSAEILDREPPNVFSIDYMGGPATFELNDDGEGGTDLLLTHSGVNREEWHEVHAGWLNVLFPLKAFLTYGVDLRNHDPNKTWDEGFVDQ